MPFLISCAYTENPSPAAHRPGHCLQIQCMAGRQKRYRTFVLRTSIKADEAGRQPAHRSTALNPGLRPGLVGPGLRPEGTQSSAWHSFPGAEGIFGFLNVQRGILFE